MKKLYVIGMIAFLFSVTPNVTASEGFVYGTLENVFGLVDEKYEECYDIINLQIRKGNNESVIIPLRYESEKSIYNFDQHSIDTLKLAIGYEISTTLEDQIIIYIDGNKDGLLEGTIFRDIDTSDWCELSFFFLEGNDLPDEEAINFRVKSDIVTTVVSGFLILPLIAIPIVAKVLKRK